MAANRQTPTKKRTPGKTPVASRVKSPAKARVNSPAKVNSPRVGNNTVNTPRVGNTVNSPRTGNPTVNSPRVGNAVNSPTTRRPQLAANHAQSPTWQQANKAVKRKLDAALDSPVRPAQISKTVEKFEVKPLAGVYKTGATTTPVLAGKPPAIGKQNKENDIESPSRIPIAVKSPIMSPLANSNQYPASGVSPFSPSKKPRMFSPDSKIPVRRDLQLDDVHTPLKSEQRLPLQTPKRSLLKRILATATPGHGSPNTLRNLTTADSTKNLTMTRYTDPQQCIDKLIDGLRIKGVECKQKGFTIRCATNNKFANVLTFNLEVCQFHGSIAIQRKRLRGDAWNYKKICEEILRISNESDGGPPLAAARAPAVLTTDI